MLRVVSLIIILIAVFSFSSKPFGDTATKQFVNFEVDTLAQNLNVPWAIAFIDDTTMLFTERNGKVRIMKDDRLIEKPVIKIDVEQNTKMGLLGLCLHPDFKMNHLLYVAYNYNQDGRELLRVVRYVFSRDSLWQPVTIVEGIFANRNHTGCRLLFSRDKKLFITTGDADIPRLSQDMKSLNGKILRVDDDGSIPQDNPFFHNDSARKQIWSYGHRNPQGIAFQPSTGLLYSSEHGPTGGDEINLIEKGKNYGWPFLHHRDEREGFVAPIMEFTPSIGPSETVFYDKDLFPELKGNLLLANLRDESIMRFNVDGKNISRLDDLLKKTYGRIRALVIAPDGSIVFSTSENDPPEGRFKKRYDMILRIRPGRGSNSNTAPVKVSPKKISAPAKKAPAKKATPVATSPGRKIYMNFCASCHGNDLRGTKAAQSLRDNKWDYGSSRKRITSSISNGIIAKGMPAWQGTFTPKQISDVTNYILQFHTKKK